MEREDLVLGRYSHQQFYEMYGVEVSKEMVDRVYLIRIIEKMEEEGMTSETYHYHLIKSDLCYKLNLTDEDVKTLKDVEVLRELVFYQQSASEYNIEETNLEQSTTEG